jgi:uncharacterized protein (DUF1697 family)
MTLSVALLRGINVGGRNAIRMPALKAAFEANGFERVVTYIQSGNVIFASPATSNAELTTRIEALLAESFGFPVPVVVRTRKQMRTVLDRAPSGFGEDAAAFRSDVIFLKEPLTAKAAIASVPTNPEVDEVQQGPGVLYFSRLIAEATRSRLNKIVSSPIYPNITIRNWNTTTRLVAMLDDASRR